MEASVIKVDHDAQEVKMKRGDGLVFTLKFSQLAAEDVAVIQNASQSPQGAPVDSTAESEDPDSEPLEIPDRFELDGVPMVKQKGNYCVPASAAMIAGFHGLKTDQDQIAQLSSGGSVNHQGTYPSDMLLAMEKLGFDGQSMHWKRPEQFETKVLPAIRKSLLQQGPVYISFKAGVFGDMGHGCIIIGYNDRRDEMTFHNPWGNVFEKDYEEVARDAGGLVFIDRPAPAPIADEAFIQQMQETIPEFDGNMLSLARMLENKGIAHELVWCSRRDSREDKRFAVDTARKEGRKILDLAFERNPAVIIPGNVDGQTTRFVFVTRPPEGGARFLTRVIGRSGWNEAELVTLGSLTKTWATKFKSEDGKDLWELPMIELHRAD